MLYPLVRFLAQYGQPLFTLHGFEITDSKNTTEGAKIYLKNAQVAVRLSQKKDQLPNLVFQSLFEKGSRTWHPLHHISTLLKRPTNCASLDSANTAFFLTHTNSIVKLFSKENTLQTLQKLKELKETQK